jgi:hypothetical protein
MLRFNSNYQNPLVPPIPVSITETINNLGSQSSTLLPLPSGVRQVFNINGKYTLDDSNGGGQTTFNLPQIEGVANAVGVAKLYAVISVIVTTPSGGIYNFLAFQNNSNGGTELGSASLAYPYTGDFDTDIDNVYSESGTYNSSPPEYDQPIINSTSTGWLSAILPMVGISGVLTGSAALFTPSTVTNDGGDTFEVGSVVHYNYAINALPASNLLTDIGLGQLFDQLESANTSLTNLETDISNVNDSASPMVTQQFFQIAANTTTEQTFNPVGFTPSFSYLVNQSINNDVSFPVQISLFNPESSSVSYTFTATYGTTTLTFSGSAAPGLSVIATIPSTLFGPDFAYSIYYISGGSNQQIGITFDTTSANAYLVVEALGIR